MTFQLPLPVRWNRRFGSLLPIFLFLLIHSANAQNEGMGLWTGVAAELRLTKKLELNAGVQTRFSDNIQVTRAYLGELGLTYKLTKHWDVSGFYRYTGRLKKNKETDTWYYRPYHRFYGEVSYDNKIWKGLKLDYRLRYQNQFKDDNDAVVADKSYFRNKLEMSWENTSRFTPFVSADLFYRIGNAEQSAAFDQVRYKAGTNVRFSKVHSLDLFLFRDAEINHSGESSGLILGATYKLKLKLNK